VGGAIRPGLTTALHSSCCTAAHQVLRVFYTRPRASTGGSPQSWRNTISSEIRALLPTNAHSYEARVLTTARSSTGRCPPAQSHSHRDAAPLRQLAYAVLAALLPSAAQPGRPRQGPSSSSPSRRLPPDSASSNPLPPALKPLLPGRRPTACSRARARRRRRCRRVPTRPFVWSKAVEQAAWAPRGGCPAQQRLRWTQRRERRSTRL